MSEQPKAEYVQPDLSLFGDEHVRRYEETDGEVGHIWSGVPCLVLTTTGRKSGQPRKNALIYGTDGDNYVVIASQGGAPTHPNWYLNLVANPNVTVQVKADRFPAVARTAEGAERERLWQLMTGIWPNYDEYATRTTRVIPVVVLERG
ncbi:MAG TPA: nitroreductase family deazaflavin-dependent oxidoreductase [Acidimicrobiales bacterium]